MKETRAASGYKIKIRKKKILAILTKDGRNFVVKEKMKRGKNIVQTLISGKKYLEAWNTDVKNTV